MDDVHALSPERFREEVHSFEFWFQAVEGYLADTHYGYQADLVPEPLPEADRERLVTALCNYCVGETAALEGASGLIGCRLTTRAPDGRAKPRLSAMSEVTSCSSTPLHGRTI